jgi:hypothetical protein
VGRAKRPNIWAVAGRAVNRCASSTFLAKRRRESKTREDNRMMPDAEQYLWACDALMCCLRYEVDFYTATPPASAQMRAPIDTPEGRGRVIDVNVFTEVVDARWATGVTSKFRRNAARFANRTRPFVRVSNHVDNGGVVLRAPTRARKCDAKGLNRFVDEAFTSFFETQRDRGTEAHRVNSRKFLENF